MGQNKQIVLTWYVSEKMALHVLRACLRKNRPVILDQKINFPYILGY